MTYTGWDANRPAFVTTQCIALFLSSAWLDVQCATSDPAVCQGKILLLGQVHWNGITEDI
jgi:hypothetical protein